MGKRCSLDLNGLDLRSLILQIFVKMHIKLRSFFLFPGRTVNDIQFISKAGEFSNGRLIYYRGDIFKEYWKCFSLSKTISFCY